MLIRSPAFTVRLLSELLAQVKDEQTYIVIRERTHRNTAESTNARVKWWSIFQLGVLIGEGVFQVWWLKRFFEVSLVHPQHYHVPALTLLLLRLSVWYEENDLGMGVARYERRVTFTSTSYTHPSTTRFEYYGVYCAVGFGRLQALYPYSCPKEKCIPF